jgi:hypothetical protein
MRKSKDVSGTEIAEARAAIVESRHVRSQFDHAEQDSSTDERVASPIDPNEWIDVMSKILHPRSLAAHWALAKNKPSEKHKKLCETGFRIFKRLLRFRTMSGSNLFIPQSSLRLEF